MPDTKFFAPTELGEALKLLKEYDGKLTVVAGGTDVVPKINYYEIRPEAMLYLGNLGLRYIKEVDGRIVMGALTRTADIAASDLIKAKAPALAEAARLSGAPATRAMATVGGNLCNASPAADLASPLLAMDAMVKLTSAKGERTMALQDFFIDVNKTALAPDELLTEISFPVPNGKVVFIKLGRRKSLTFSVVNVSVRLARVQDGTCHQARIVLGSMAPVPKRCIQAEAMIEGAMIPEAPELRQASETLSPAAEFKPHRILDSGLIAQAAKAAVAATSPIDDQRASAWYRAKAAEGLVARALRQAAGFE